VFNTARLQASAAKLLMARAAFVALVIVTLTLFTLQDDVQTARSVTFVGTRIRWNIAREHTARLEPWSLAPTPREPGASRSLRLHTVAWNSARLCGNIPARTVSRCRIIGLNCRLAKWHPACDALSTKVIGEAMTRRKWGNVDPVKQKNVLSTTRAGASSSHTTSR